MTKKSEKQFGDEVESLAKDIEAIYSKPKIEKEIKKMKTLTTPSTKKTIIITVVVTLVIVGALVAQALYFYNSGANSQKAENARITAAVAHQVAELSKTKQ